MTSIFSSYETVIGLECHVQLSTATKLFSPAKNHYGDAPNTNVDVVDAGLPGVLPVINKRAIEFAIRLGLALGCQIRHTSVFSRKHYFYPDLPKGYQISQYDLPICENGAIEITTKAGPKTIRITRIHIEEDAGKNIHVEGGNASFVDYNRAGTPLLEVVTEPDITCAEEAMEVFKTLRAIAMYIDVCDGNLQEGSMRADCNVSVRKAGNSKLGTRTETKNLNSIRFLGQAIEFESRRQILELEAGNSIVQETRLWDSSKKESRSLRSKEEAHDYRYFPDPDLLPLVVGDELIKHIQSILPELPQAKAERLEKSLGLSAYDAHVLTAEKAVADYFESALALHANAKSIANWVINDILRIVKQDATEMDSSGIEKCSISPAQIAELVRLIDTQVISGKIAKAVFEKMLEDTAKMPSQIVEENGWRVVRDEGALLCAIDEVFSEQAGEVAKYKAGKTNVFGFLVGQVMAKTKGQSDPKEVNRLLREKLSSTTELL